MNANWPKAYRDGVVDFYGREFQVSPAVLIPRPETEMIVDSVLVLAGKSYLPGVRAPQSVISGGLSILDVGTGSGCLAVTLGLELPAARVFAVDVSPAALEVAKENARRLGAKVEFYDSDLFSNVPEEVFSAENLVVVANLPYVDPDWEWLDRESLSYEPEMALFAKGGGLSVYVRFFQELQGLACGKTCGKLWVVIEADPCQHARLKKYAESLGFRHTKTRGFALEFTYGG